jgi:3',5'-cyclic AMP phosphodiesterase CpdA
MGSLGHEQLEWFEDDLKGRSASTPIVLFAHIPLWTVYPDWGWGTDDSEQALSYVKRFGSVTVLNGHIHQIMQKVEGKVSFHTRDVDRFPSTCAGNSSLSRTHEGASRPVAAGVGYHGRELCGQRAQPGNRRFATQGLGVFGFREWRRLGRSWLALG